ncbi:MAG: hypothetical protein ABSF53_19090 [Terracidiphilus sp.]|jgi:hypothetical protein
MMSSSKSVRCANQNCETQCGTDLDLDDGVIVDDRSGDVFCSQDCYDASHPVYCADCGDEKVGKEGDRCTYCTITAEQGEDAAYAWYLSQHPELGRKPVASVPAPAPRAIVGRTSYR